MILLDCRARPHPRRQGARARAALAALLLSSLATFGATATVAATATAIAADAPVNIELGQRGKPEAPGAPIACMEAVKAGLPNPDRFRWVRSTTRKVAEDAYSVVGDVEFVAKSGEARKVEAQCDVMRAPGNQFIVPKVRLPANAG